jgi:hypothetical protein
VNGTRELSVLINELFGVLRRRDGKSRTNRSADIGQWRSRAEPHAVARPQRRMSCILVIYAGGIFMLGRYAYSMNGEDYVGSFTAREAAEAAALEAARRSAEPPVTVFVGRIVAAVPATSGHAREVLSHMRYLANLSAAQVEELDCELEKTIVSWLNKHELMPQCFRVEAISEHPVPATPENHVLPRADEVHDLGVGDALAGIS